MLCSLGPSVYPFGLVVILISFESFGVYCPGPGIDLSTCKYESYCFLFVNLNPFFFGLYSRAGTFSWLAFSPTPNPVVGLFYFLYKNNYQNKKLISRTECSPSRWTTKQILLSLQLFIWVVLARPRSSDISDSFGFIEVKLISKAKLRTLAFLFWLKVLLSHLIFIGFFGLIRAFPVFGSFFLFQIFLLFTKKNNYLTIVTISLIIL